MGSGKLVLLFIAGSVSAGILVAGATTHGIHSYPKISLPGASSERIHEPPPARSWLDDGLSTLDVPAWPFGRDEWDGSDDTGGQDWPGSPAGPQGHDDGLLQDVPSGTADPGYGPAPGAPPAPGTGPVDDAAAEAAQRAAAAAADVSAAERGLN
ncbi:hypothetical protein [Novosphingobium album (ex Hu et al. 2023)]|uniref:Uncharacterized protein n=1 Tax=Novosphingobium album (ex Hu et al. 2023) TaxID=2930093 RepID=A0ABT0B4F1_9SPHN|nr:hypothetical protein [Novosphingobium album (ex Hu et al. 2023)]MCJ2179748.1 hypothetical protein [Novosphingobium album (ex Hu et al. 2023)]